MVLFGSSLNNGDGFKNGRGSHYGDFLATILCGGKGLGINSGQHLKFEGEEFDEGEMKMGLANQHSDLIIVF